jgi:hypothetical protein
MRGKGIIDTVKKVHKFVKDNKLISSGLGLIGQPGLGSVAGMLGYGRRRKARSRRTRRVSSAPVALVGRRMRGRGPLLTRSTLASAGIVPFIGMGGKKVMRGKGIFSDLGGGIGSVFGGLGGGLGSALGGLFGRGRRRGRAAGTPAGRSGIKI